MNWKLIILALIIVIIGIAAYFFFFFILQKPNPETTITSIGFGQPSQYIPPPFDQSPVSPTTFVTSFYSWYLQSTVNDPRFVLSDEYKTAIAKWLMPEFIANWNTIVENTNENPVLLAQDYADSWLTNIQASVTAQTATTTTVLVSLGIRSEIKTLNVELVNFTDGLWRISGVSSER